MRAKTPLEQIPDRLRQRCVTCKAATADRRCDFVKGDGNPCGADCCPSHSHEIDGKDYCPAHEKAIRYKFDELERLEKFKRESAIAREAYRAYGDSVGWLAFTGTRMPTFEDLPPRIVSAWIAAAQAARKAKA